MALYERMRSHVDKFIQGIKPHYILLTLLDHNVVDEDEHQEIINKEDHMQSEELMNILLTKSEDKLCCFADILNSEDIEIHRQLYILIKTDVSDHRSQRTNIPISPSKDLYLEGYPYDVKDVEYSAIKGCKYYNFKMHTSDGYVDVVSAGFLLDENQRIKKLENSGGGLSLRNFSEKNGTVYLSKDTKLDNILLQYSFMRKVYTLRESRHKHYGSIIDIEFKVCKVLQPETVELKNGNPIKKQNFLVGDELGYMWLVVWEWEGRQLAEDVGNSILKRGQCYKMKKCQVATLYDLKYIQTKVETVIESTERAVTPLQLDDKDWKILLQNRVTEVSGMIVICKPDCIVEYQGCPTCKRKVKANSDNEEQYICDNCGEYGLNIVTEKRILASPKLMKNGTRDMVKITLHEEMLQNVINAHQNAKGESERRIDELTPQEIASMVMSQQKWQVRITPAGNVVNIKQQD